MTRAPASSRPRAIRLSVRLGGGATLVLGVLVMLAWWTHRAPIIQLSPGGVAMKFNTALALALGGAALLAASWGHKRVVRAAGTVVALIGGTALLQHLLGWEWYINQLLASDYLAEDGLPPGLPALNTALCLLVVGLGLVSWSPRGGGSWKLPLAAVVSESIAVVSLSGYLIDLPSAYSWGASVSMAAPTAVSLVVLAVGLFGLDALGREHGPGLGSEFLAVSLGLTAFLVSGLLGWAVAGAGGDAAISARAEIRSAARATLVMALISGGMLGLTTWLAQRARTGWREADVRAARLSAEMDLTARAQAELEASEARIARILDTLPVSVIVAAPGPKVHYANAAALRTLTGGDRDEVLSPTDFVETFDVRDAATGERISALHFPMSQALDGHVAHAEDLAIQTALGRRLFEAWAEPLLAPNGEVELSVTAFVDITERRATEDHVAEMAALLDLAHDAVMIWDDDTRLVYWNRGAELTYGYPAERALGAHVDELLRTDFPQDVELIRARLSECGRWDGELRQRTADDQQLVLTSRWSEAPMTSGTARTMAVNRDVTTRARAEAALASRAEELQVANLELSRSNRDLEQFAYAASHDLAEPLRAIAGPVALLARRYEGALDEEADEWISFAVEGCQRMQALIDGLLLVSQTNRREVPRAPLDASRVVGDLLADMQPEIEQRCAVVVVGDLPTVWALEQDLELVLRVLVTNALTFSRPGVAPEIHIAAVQTEAGWRFTVDDNGIGVAPRHRQRIFGLFKRLNSREDYPGAGIGLALALKIIERQGGEIGVDLGPDGIGSTFWFTLPQRKADRS